MHDDSEDAKSRKDVPFGVSKIKDDILPLFSALKHQFFCKITDLQNF